MADAGTNLHDYKGMCEGYLLTANDAGTNLFDAKGMAQGGLGTTTAVTGGGAGLLMMGIGG